VVCIAQKFWVFTHCFAVVNGGSDSHAALAVNDSLADWIACDKPFAKLSPSRCLVQQPAFIRLSIRVASAVVALQMYWASVAAASNECRTTGLRARLERSHCSHVWTT
jgi:hypothetical protein